MKKPKVEKVMFSMRMPKQIHDKIKKLAKREGHNVTTIVAYCLSLGLTDPIWGKAKK